MTVAFLGDRAPEDADEIARLAFGAVAPLSAPRLRFGALRGVPAGRPRLFALDLDDEGGSAAAVAAAVGEALAAAGLYAPERRSFWAHVTVARVRRGVRPPEVGEDSPGGSGFRAAALTLYRSRPGLGGPRYEALRRSGLG